MSDQENTDDNEAVNDVLVNFNYIGLEGGNEERYGRYEEEGNAVENSGGGYIYVVIGPSKRT